MRSMLLFELLCLTILAAVTAAGTCNCHVRWTSPGNINVNTQPHVSYTPVAHTAPSCSDLLYFTVAGESPTRCVQYTGLLNFGGVTGGAIPNTTAVSDQCMLFPGSGSAIPVCPRDCPSGLIRRTSASGNYIECVVSTIPSASVPFRTTIPISTNFTKMVRYSGCLLGGTRPYADHPLGWPRCADASESQALMRYSMASATDGQLSLYAALEQAKWLCYTTPGCYGVVDVAASRHGTVNGSGISFMFRRPYFVPPYDAGGQTPFATTVANRSWFQTLSCLIANCTTCGTGDNKRPTASHSLVVPPIAGCANSASVCPLQAETSAHTMTSVTNTVYPPAWVWPSGLSSVLMPPVDIRERYGTPMELLPDAQIAGTVMSSCTTTNGGVAYLLERNFTFPCQAPGDSIWSVDPLYQLILSIVTNPADSERQLFLSTVRASILEYGQTGAWSPVDNDYTMTPISVLLEPAPAAVAGCSTQPPTLAAHCLMGALGGIPTDVWQLASAPAWLSSARLTLDQLPVPVFESAMSDTNNRTQTFVVGDNLVVFYVARDLAPPYGSGSGLVWRRNMPSVSSGSVPWRRVLFGDQLSLWLYMSWLQWSYGDIGLRSQLEPVPTCSLRGWGLWKDGSRCGLTPSDAACPLAVQRAPTYKTALSSWSYSRLVNDTNYYLPTKGYQSFGIPCSAHGFCAPAARVGQAMRACLCQTWYQTRTNMMTNGLRAGQVPTALTWLTRYVNTGQLGAGCANNEFCNNWLQNDQVPPMLRNDDCGVGAGGCYTFEEDGMCSGQGACVVASYDGFNTQSACRCTGADLSGRVSIPYGMTNGTVQCDRIVTTAAGYEYVRDCESARVLWPNTGTGTEDSNGELEGHCTSPPDGCWDHMNLSTRDWNRPMPATAPWTETSGLTYGCTLGRDDQRTGFCESNACRCLPGYMGTYCQYPSMRVGTGNQTQGCLTGTADARCCRSTINTATARYIRLNNCVDLNGYRDCMHMPASNPSTWQCPNGTFEVQCLGQEMCSGHGTCLYEGVATYPYQQCRCEIGYTGAQCQTLTCIGASRNNAVCMHGIWVCPRDTYNFPSTQTVLRGRGTDAGVTFTIAGMPLFTDESNCTQQAPGLNATHISIIYDYQQQLSFIKPPPITPGSDLSVTAWAIGCESGWRHWPADLVLAFNTRDLVGRLCRARSCPLYNQFNSSRECGGSESRRATTFCTYDNNNPEAPRCNCKVATVVGETYWRVATDGGVCVNYCGNTGAVNATFNGCACQGFYYGTRCERVRCDYGWVTNSSAIASLELASQECTCNSTGQKWPATQMRAQCPPCRPLDQYPDRLGLPTVGFEPFEPYNCRSCAGSCDMAHTDRCYLDAGGSGVVHCQCHLASLPASLQSTCSSNFWDPASGCRTYICNNPTTSLRRCAHVERELCCVNSENQFSSPNISTGVCACMKRHPPGYDCWIQSEGEWCNATVPSDTCPPPPVSSSSSSSTGGYESSSSISSTGGEEMSTESSSTTTFDPFSSSSSSTGREESISSSSSTGGEEISTESSSTTSIPFSSSSSTDSSTASYSSSSLSSITGGEQPSFNITNSSSSSTGVAEPPAALATKYVALITIFGTGALVVVVLALL